MNWLAWAQGDVLILIRCAMSCTTSGLEFARRQLSAISVLTGLGLPRSMIDAWSSFVMHCYALLTLHS